MPVYKTLPFFTRDRVITAIKENDVATLIPVALSVATYDPDWKYAQDLCIRLSEHSNASVRGNAILALGYVARVHRRLEKRIVKPVLLRAQKDSEAEVCSRADDAVDDINLYLNWWIGRRGT